jgi:GNAT superfamily N-acetyltransferase
MRAREFVAEAKTVEYNGLSLRIKKPTSYELRVEALDDWGNNVLGYVEFDIGDDRELDPQDLRVDDRYQGQGIAKTMYDYVKSLGYKIVRSWDQTDAGAGFWDKHRGQDVRVWEQGVAEGLDAEAYKQKLLSSLPQMMRFYEKNVQGWKPSEEQMLAAVETGYTVMKHTGDVKQAGKAVMDELNTLHRMSQGQQGVAEEQLDELSFLGSECTKDCSGHRAGYDWSKRKGLRQANSWSPSFNKGAGLAVAGK